MKRCIDLAKNGLISAKPNPSVGSVIVYNDKVIGEGYTSPYGGNHAEVNAIDVVANKEELKDATLYVSLEPCNHFGKTPPCSDLIIQYGIKKVVIGCVDPYKKVAGAGIEKLKLNGCEVIVGVLEEECKAINKRFFTFHTKKRPYIILKWAETKDGFIDKIRNGKSELQPNWITNKHSRQLVHKWRAEEDAILIGTNTGLNDNPTLDVRDWVGNNPTRIVIDRQMRIPKTHHIYNGSVKTIVLTESKQTALDTAIFEQLDFSKNLPNEIIRILNKYETQSLFVEGGRQTLQTFIDAGLWDEARIFTGDCHFKEGLEAPTIAGKIIKNEFIQSDLLKTIRNVNS